VLLDGKLGTVKDLFLQQPSSKLTTVYQTVNIILTLIYHMRNQIYSCKAIHSGGYHLSLVRLLIRLLRAEKTDAEIADALNILGLKTQTGLEWRTGNVKSLLNSLRHSQHRSSKLYQAILKLFFDDKITREETDVLFQHRRDYRGQTM